MWKFISSYNLQLIIILISYKTSSEWNYIEFTDMEMKIYFNQHLQGMWTALIINILGKWILFTTRPCWLSDYLRIINLIQNVFLLPQKLLVL